MLNKVLILDANQRSALAATRSLGVKGVPVIVADETGETLAGSSKYCKESFVYPSPYKEPGNFIETMKEQSIERDVKVIFPMTEISTYLLLKHRDRFTDIGIPFAPFETFEQLTDKRKLFELAQQIGIPIPVTYFIENQKDISVLYPKLKFPVVLKPYRSRIWSDGLWLSASVRYANSVPEMEEIIAKTDCFNQHPFLIQEYIYGKGQGIFTLFNHGTPVTFFAHRRLREKPPSGGVSVLCESIPVNPEMKEMAQKLLEHVSWHGVAMIEFKVDNEGNPYLMEVNARFWGSLQLAINAGVDFPYLLYLLAIGEKIETIQQYKIGVRNRWLLGDLDHLYLQIFKNEGRQANSLTGKWQSIKDFIKLFDRRTFYEVNRWDDLKPFFLELKRYIFN